jgi:hypothetical protein
MNQMFEDEPGLVKHESHSSQFENEVLMKIFGPKREK